MILCVAAGVVPAAAWAFVLSGRLEWPESRLLPRGRVSKGCQDTCLPFGVHLPMFVEDTEKYLFVKDSFIGEKCPRCPSPRRPHVK